MKKTVAVTVLMGLMVACVGSAHATADPTNDTDQIIITITPNVDRGVEIDTSAVVMNLGSVDVNTATQTVKPATVTVLGTMSAQELDLNASISGGWSFDTTPSVDTSSGETDMLAAYVLFSATTLSLAPSSADFANATADASYASGTQRVGGASSGGNKYEKQGDGSVDMDASAPNDTAHMWLFFRLPSDTSVTSAQSVTLTLTAVDAS